MTEYTDVLTYLDKLYESGTSPQVRLRRLHQLYEYLLVDITDDSQVQLSSSFSRLSYLIAEYKISGRESYVLHSFRMALRGGRGKGDILLAEAAISILLVRVLKVDYDFEHGTEDAYTRYMRPKDDVSTYHPGIFVMLISVDVKRKIACAQLYEEPFDEITIDLDRADRTVDHLSIFLALGKQEAFPVMAYLIDVEVDKDDRYQPLSVVLDPYYLYDVTAVSECFGTRVPQQASYLLRRFMSGGVSIPITVGNMANYFLDQLLYSPNLTFNEIRSELFGMDPLSLGILDDDHVRKVISGLKLHFENLKRVVSTELPKEGVTRENSYIEPAFYSIKYGLQGRLDLLKKDKTMATIVELKSGSPFRPNAYGVSSSHYHQTLLYDLIIESAYGRSVKRKNFILYSKELGNNLRFAPSLRIEQRESIKMRNRLWLTDYMLSNRVGAVEYLRSFYSRYAADIIGYQKSDFAKLLKVFSQLNPEEVAYCECLIRFVLKEQRMSKLGSESGKRYAGLAAMWSDPMTKKIDQFAIINHLMVSSDNTLDSDPILVLSKTENTAKLSNFRVGDLIVLYRDDGSERAMLNDQVFKGTLLGQNSDIVTVRLRSRQLNRGIFTEDSLWHIEQDRLDSGFHHMTRAVAEFASAKANYRAKMMGVVGPTTITGRQVKFTNRGNTDEQNILLGEIVAAQDYYLLWGPPGTGKTSIMIRSLIDYYYHHTEDRILLLSYTNRAVDEICHAIKSIDTDIDFIRIGSRYGTDDEYRDNLLNHRLSDVTSRAALKELLSSTRVYVGTVASVVGKPQLFDLLTFNIGIVDEASQILDAPLIGVLSRVDKFVLVGDHLQLPAVVQQDRFDTVIMDDKLTSIGITNLSNSLFERMYKRAVRQEWTHAYGQLSYQGRMHEQLLEFTNDYFYDNSLHVLGGLDRLTETPKPVEGRTVEIKVLSEQRMIFIPTDIDWDSENSKTNLNEVRVVIQLIQSLQTIQQERGQVLAPHHIGIITPYRAQIACIVDELEVLDPKLKRLITVDTVERYQGGARDIIIMSTAINLPYQLKSLVSPSDEGIDRKLNVAYTRARKQFILVGCESLLRADKTYAALIDRCYRLHL